MKTRIVKILKNQKAESMHERLSRIEECCGSEYPVARTENGTLWVEVTWTTKPSQKQRAELDRLAAGQI